MELPAGVAGEVEITLYQPDDGIEVASAAATEGSVDLNGLFPVLWTATSPITVYAQLLVDDEPIGSPVVLIPMVSPNLAYLSGRAVVFTNRQPQTTVYAGLRAWTDRHVVFTTTLGDIEFQLRPDKAPNTVANFIDLVEGGYYTDIIFHRIIGPRDGRDPFMAQVGDPTGTGGGGPGRFIDLEQSDLPHDFGVLSMARTGDPNTNGGQVFVCFSRNGTSFLDAQYCSFAQAVSGADTILALEAVETGEQDRPNDPPVLKSAKTIPAPPFGTGPKPLTRPETTER
ncbi:Peptidyl-prolyl cis-trans isomerase [hydrothermal vent metagenome]|uniref:peptidylprolyl isomerase n=1 Tax=hydrothermal vent metagenome TaxID=652676 RepID=A0A3B1DDS3_9ZZZZ